VLFVAGDDDQSIYQQMRHAHPDGIREFDTSHDAADLRLATCVRCDRRIISVATSVIRQEAGRTDKRLEPHATAGQGIVESLVFDDTDDEARGVATLVDTLVRAGIARHEVMILIRSDKHGRFSAPIHQALNDIGVASVVRTAGETEMDGSPGRVVLSYLRLVVDDRDHLAWRTVLSEGGLRIGEKAIAELHAVSAANNSEPLTDVLDRVVDDPALCPSRGNDIVRAVASVRATIDGLRAEVASTGDVGDQVALALAKLALSFGDLTLVKGELDVILSESRADDLEGLLGQVSLRREGEQEAISPNTVNIITMHKAKGLDACVVIVMATDNELVPGDNNIIEERRLFYVSITRARHALFVTHAKRRLGQQQMSGIRTRRDHQRTIFLGASGLRTRRGREFVEGYVPNLALLAPLPNPED
jgi:DNA helicase II / ATP-dependent DNA helicase PcrA